MKLIDILVEELPKRDGWPKRANCIIQDPDKIVEHATCHPSVAKCGEDGFWFLDSSRIGGFEVDTLASDYTTAIITREQYEAALSAKNDGWIEWGGGECPVPRGTLVDVRYRDGRQLNALSANDGTLNPRDASFVFWRNDGSEKDIIAYRLHKTNEAERVRDAAWNAYAAITKADDEADLNECIGQDAEPVWGGEGKPDIGEKCEHYSGGQWEVVTIAGIYENLVTGFTDYWMIKEDGGSYTVGNPYRFRPIRSEADKKREEAIMSLAKSGGAASFKYGEKFNDGSLIGAAWYELYDAIAAGKVRGVKLED